MSCKFSFKCAVILIRIVVSLLLSRCSQSACNAFVEKSNSVFHQNWSPGESAQSSTWRELKAVSLALEAFASHFYGFKVLWYTNNHNFESMIVSGSRKADFHQLADLALLVFKVCLKFRMSLEVKWIPRDLNTKPHAISKLIDHDACLTCLSLLIP